jgi:hypothetical protein
MLDKASVVSAFPEESVDLSPGFWHGPVPNDLGVLWNRSYPLFTNHVAQVLYLTFEEEALLWLQLRSCLSECLQDRLQCGKVFS